jgi:DNA mismatch endonuclease (patch repair protein)
MSSIVSGIQRPSRGKTRTRKRRPKKSHGTKPERALFAHLPARMRPHFETQGRIAGHRSVPDLVSRALMIAVYVDGCRWHGCLEHGGDAFQSAREKDARVAQALVADGWMVLRIWQHESFSVAVRVISQMVRGRLKAHDKRD